MKRGNVRKARNGLRAKGDGVKGNREKTKLKMGLKGTRQSKNREICSAEGKRGREKEER